MSKLVIAAGLAALAAVFGGSASARTAAPAAPVAVTIRSHALATSAPVLLPGTHAFVVRNATASPRTLELVRLPGGAASLVRFEGLFFLPSSSNVVRNFGRIAPGHRARASISLPRGDYVVAVMSGSAVAAAHDLRVG
jgi:hypothetical protein